MSLTHLQHSLDRRDGLFGCLFFYLHLRLLIPQARIHFLKCIHPHILAFITRATYALCNLRRNRDKLLIRACTLHLIQNSAFCGNYKAFGGLLDGVLEESLRRTDYVALRQNRCLTFRMCQHFYTRISGFEFQ